MKRRLIAAVLAACALAAACAKKPLEARPGQTWTVSKAGRQVLTLKNEPGPLYSTAMLPPGVEPARHPFLSAKALYPLEEDALGRAIQASASFEDLLRRLQAQGYTVEAED